MFAYVTDRVYHRNRVSSINMLIAELERYHWGRLSCRGRYRRRVLQRFVPRGPATDADASTAGDATCAAGIIYQGNDFARFETTAVHRAKRL